MAETTFAGRAAEQGVGEAAGARLSVRVAFNGGIRDDED
jgi:hypothetical protein